MTVAAKAAPLLVGACFLSALCLGSLNLTEAMGGTQVDNLVDLLQSRFGGNSEIVFVEPKVDFSEQNIEWDNLQRSHNLEMAGLKGEIVNLRQQMAKRDTELALLKRFVQAQNELTVQGIEREKLRNGQQPLDLREPGADSE